MKKGSVSGIVIAKNEEKKLADCLHSIDWVDEIVLVDTGSKDNTINIARAFNAKVVNYSKGSYSDWRNKGKNEAEGEWLIYIDADERMSPLLSAEIKKVTAIEDQYSAYAIPRKNIILGKEMRYGGWWPDYVIRLFRKKDLEKWQGDLHEEPQYKGNLGYLKNAFIHIKHDNLSEMIVKSNQWSEKEAELFIKANHPLMSWWRFLRIMVTEAWYRLVVLKGFLDGTAGIIYGLYQMWYRFMVYAKLWEMQSDILVTKERSLSEKAINK